MKLNDIAYFVDDKISSDEISLNEYITTDCLLQNKKGRTIATNLPPQSCSLTKFKKGDVLIGNIRPYLKKIWFADIDGGSSLDVLVLRAKDKNESAYLYSVLMQDSFYDFVMKAPKGSKMPRGDKNHILTFPCSNVNHKIEIGNFIKSLDDKIALNRRMNAKLEQMAKRLYDHWFVQFDFPNANGKPYKASGGKMEYNEVLKREIPAGWEVKRLGDVCEIFNGSTPLTADNDNYGGDIIWITPKDLSEQKSKFVYQGTRNITQKGYNSCSTTFVPKGTVVMSSRAPIGLLSIAMCELCTNQGFKNLVPKNKDYTNLLYYTLLNYIPQIQNLGTGTTFKEVSKEKLSNFSVLYPSDNFIKMFAKKTLSIFNYQLSIEKETQKLTALRDRLLPLLMNGQVEVK